ncbi:hypothetical protein L6164_026419 [Bauhinia variegata]|uniref:Uncharacterized protein n=1 Tax=Bauhinia variegata TaxID=167791 RepID=A0ACB9LQ24_BAUVA|nr:hypothetical protein L6164_026419 [Bauhinia variegata]
MGTLRKTCESGNYNTVILTFLSQFGPQIEPKVRFADGLCGEPITTCDLPSQIEYCQSQGIKVFLSVGSASSGSQLYNIPTAAYAKELGTYLWKNFLSGQDGPLGIVTLDGIEFFFQG